MDYFVSGAVAGCVGTLVSHPFFTLKVCLQNGSSTKLKKTVMQNLKWLYKGFSFAVVGYSIEKTLVFGSYMTILNTIESNSLIKNKVGKFSSLVAGFLAGTVASLSITIFEQMTICAQRNHKIKHITLHQICRGLLPTMAREAVGFSIYFTIYDKLSNMYNKNKVSYKTALIGIPSIVCAWIVITPIDKIKTNVQSNVPINIYSLSSAYKGFPFVMLRAVPFHTTCFVVFEYMMKKLKP